MARPEHPYAPNSAGATAVADPDDEPAVFGGEEEELPEWDRGTFTPEDDGDFDDDGDGDSGDSDGFDEAASRSGAIKMGAAYRDDDDAVDDDGDGDDAERRKRNRRRDDPRIQRRLNDATFYRVTNGPDNTSDPITVYVPRQRNTKALADAVWKKVGYEAGCYTVEKMVPTDLTRKKSHKCEGFLYVILPEDTSDYEKWEKVMTSDPSDSDDGFDYTSLVDDSDSHSGSSADRHPAHSSSSFDAESMIEVLKRLEDDREDRRRGGGWSPSHIIALIGVTAPIITKIFERPPDRTMDAVEAAMRLSKESNRPAWGDYLGAGIGAMAAAFGQGMQMHQPAAQAAMQQHLPPPPPPPTSAPPPTLPASAPPPPKLPRTATSASESGDDSSRRRRALWKALSDAARSEGAKGTTVEHWLGKILSMPPVTIVSFVQLPYGQLLAEMQECDWPPHSDDEIARWLLTIRASIHAHIMEQQKRQQAADDDAATDNDSANEDGESEDGGEDGESEDGGEAPAASDPPPNRGGGGSRTKKKSARKG